MATLGLAIENLTLISGNVDTATWQNVKNHPPNIVSMSLRNELRKSSLTSGLKYNCATWWDKISSAAENIHAATADLLITISGLNYDVDLSALSAQSNLLIAPNAGSNMDPPDDSMTDHIADLDETAFGKASKAVLELHVYKQSVYYGSYLEYCDAIQAGLYRFGLNALGKKLAPSACSNTSSFTDPYSCPDAHLLRPVLLTEFGDVQDDNYKSITLQKCLRDYATKNKVDWAHWSLAGSFRLRQSTVMYNDTSGLTNSDWSAYQSSDAVDNFFRPWIKDMGPTGSRNIDVLRDLRCFVALFF